MIRKAIILSACAALALALVGCSAQGTALTESSLSADLLSLEHSLVWDGQGSDSLHCEKLGESPERTADGWIHWIVTQAGGITEAELVLGGSGSGEFAPTKYGPVVEFFTPYFDVEALTATLYYAGALGGNTQFVISDYCPGIFDEPQAELYIIKFYDANANGEWDLGEPELLDWYLAIDGELYSTPFSEIVGPGTYLISELMPEACADCGCYWVASGIAVEGTENYIIVSDTEVEVVLADEDTVTIFLGNYCLCPSGGLSPGYWSQVITSKGVSVDSRRISADLYQDFVAYLGENPVNLVNNDGSTAEFSNALELSLWIGSGLNAANMSAQLSRHTAAMILNILSGAVDGNAYYIPAGMTVQEIVNAAKAFLNENPITTEEGELRDEAEQLKDWLDELNNDAGVVPAEPCPYTFTFEPEE